MSYIGGVLSLCFVLCIKVEWIVCVICWGVWVVWLLDAYLVCLFYFVDCVAELPGFVWLGCFSFVVCGLFVSFDCCGGFILEIFGCGFG